MATAFDLELFEQEISDVIQAVTGDGADVRPLPETNEEFEVAFDKPLLWVGYNQSDYGETKALLIVAQDENITFIVTICSRSLRGANSIYALKKKVHKALCGYKPAACTEKIYPVYFGPPKSDDAFINGCFTYEYHFKTQTQSVQDIAENDTLLIESYKGSSFMTNVTPPLISYTDGIHQ